MLFLSFLLIVFGYLVTGAAVTSLCVWTDHTVRGAVWEPLDFVMGTLLWPVLLLIWLVDVAQRRLGWVGLWVSRKLERYLDWLERR